MDRPVSGQLLLLVLVLSVEVTSAAAAATPVLPQAYWKKVLPHTPIPTAVRHLLLPPDAVDEKGTPADTAVPHRNPFWITYATTERQIHHNPAWITYGATERQIHRNPAWITYRATERQVQRSPSYAATETQVHDDTAVAFFFLEKDLLIPGGKMKQLFTRTTRPAPFIPRAVADVIPFSSKNLSDVLTHLSLQPNSREAEAVKETIQECEEPAAVGEIKRCVTSLESMVDFATSTLGTSDVRAVSTEVGKDVVASKKLQYYTVAPPGAQTVLAGGRSVSCHQQPYPHAVFYCHSTPAAKVYSVPLVGENGAKVSAAAVCHVDTSAWDRGHVAFRVLKVKPGTVPVCHFLSQDHLVWVPSFNGITSF